jgi:hypothetical protein
LRRAKALCSAVEVPRFQQVEESVEQIEIHLCESGGAKVGHGNGALISP